jgi:hypothetical protein
MSNMIHNEQIRLTANFCNSLATGCVVGGVFVPTIVQEHVVPLIVGAAVVAFGIALHRHGRRMLKELRE